MQDNKNYLFVKTIYSKGRTTKITVWSIPSKKISAIQKDKYTEQN